MVYPEEGSLALGEQGTPELWLGARLHTELLDQRSDNRFERHAVCRKMHAVKINLLRVRERAVDLKVRCRVLLTREPEVVATKDRLFPFAIKLILVAR